MGDWDDMQDSDYDFDGFDDHYGGDIYDMDEDVSYMEEYEELGDDMELESDSGLIKIKNMTNSNLKDIFNQNTINGERNTIQVIAEMELMKRRKMKIEKITNNIDLDDVLHSKER